MSKTFERITGIDAGGAALGSFSGATHTLLRVGAGALFLQHGLQKLFGILGGFMGTPGATAPLMSQMGLAGVLEVGGGLLLIAGLLTRPVAVVLVLQMIAAYFIAHLPQGGFPIQNGGELALLFATTFAFLAGNGAGPLSLDRWIATRRATLEPRAVTAATEVRAGGRERRPRAA